MREIEGYNTNVKNPVHWIPVRGCKSKSYEKYIGERLMLKQCVVILYKLPKRFRSQSFFIRGELLLFLVFFFHFLFVKKHIKHDTSYNEIILT